MAFFILAGQVLKNFVVYKSSAGSGKTFTLVKEYLRLSLHDETKLQHIFKRILAITFTNKAAAEMKSRVLEALEHISTQQKMPFIGTLLCQELQLPEEQLRERAAILLSAILHHYSDFAIGTIDSFTHKIVKTFAHDLKLPVNFTIELDTRGFYNKVVANLLNKIGEDPYISKLLTEFVLNKAEDNKGWDPEDQILKFSELLEKEHSEDYLEQLKHFDSNELEEFRKQFLDFCSYYKSTMKGLGVAMTTKIHACGLNDQDFVYKKSGPQNFFTKAENNLISAVEINGARINNAIATGTWFDKKLTLTTELLQLKEELKEGARAIMAFYEENGTYYNLCELLSKQMYPLMLLKKIEEITLEQKQEDRLVFISEFNQKIYDIIHHEPTPFIYERLGERYRHYLLDEFQDTSTLQWQNMLPLIDNALSGGWYNLIVGDGKQSIYRWRNANVNQFDLLPQVENSDQNPILLERENSLKRNFEARRLNTNFRSAAGIVQFNNQLFEVLSGELLDHAQNTIYASQAQQVNPLLPKEVQGYITVQTGRVPAEEFNNSQFEALRQHVQDALHNGYEYRDICVLTSTNQHGNLIASFLVEQKIPVVSADSLLLKNNTEVNTLVAWLRYLQNNHDQLQAAIVVNYLHRTGLLTATQLHEHLQLLGSGSSLFSIFKTLQIPITASQTVLNNLLDNCILFINALQMHQHNHQYLRFFLDEVNEFMVLKNTGISGFLDWWESRKSKASLIIPDGINAVRIMTIHASKGLEFPVVIVPFCNWPVYKPNNNWVQLHHQNIQLPVAVIELTAKAVESGLGAEYENEQQAQVLDNLNKLYVAFTRAVSRLHILATCSSGNHKVGVHHWLEGYLAKGEYAVEEGLVAFGDPNEKAIRHQKQNLEHFSLLPLQFNASPQAVSIKSSGLLNHAESEEAKQHGLLMHWLLAKIKTASDIETSLQAANRHGLVHYTDIPVLRVKLQQVLDHPQLAPWFKTSLDCRLEAELVTANGTLLRPDRIVITGSDAVVIDYKTGLPNPQKYNRQLLQYADALISMGLNVTQKLLVYLDDLTIVPVK